MEISPFTIGNSFTHGGFSMAMLDYRRVTLMPPWPLRSIVRWFSPFPRPRRRPRAWISLLKRPSWWLGFARYMFLRIHGMERYIYLYENHKTNQLNVGEISKYTWILRWFCGMHWVGNYFWGDQTMQMCDKVEGFLLSALFGLVIF